MLAFIQFLIAICPIVPLFYLVIKICRFCNILNKRRCIREKNISFKGIKDFLPKKIRQELESDSSIVKRFIDEILKVYRKLLLALVVYLLFWIFYLAGIVIRIVRLFNNYYEILEPHERGCVVGSILISILILYWFLLIPVFEFLHWKKLSSFGYNIWNFIQDLLKKIEKWFKQILKYFCEIVISFFPMFGYITLARKILVIVQIELTFWMALLMLILYQYMIVKIFAHIIKGIIMFIIKKNNRLQGVEKYARGEMMYLILKNCTYLSMVLVYAVAVGMDNSEKPLAAAIGILFLIDTFFVQEKAIQQKMDKSNLE